MLKKTVQDKFKEEGEIYRFKSSKLFKYLLKKSQIWRALKDSNLRPSV